MAIAESDRLRQLVSDYYHGLITPESYRQQRATLLDNIGANVEATPKTVPRKREEPDQRAEKVETPPKPTSDTPTSGRKTGVLLIGAIVVVGVVAGVLLMLMPGSEQGPGEDSAAAQITVTEEVSTEFGNSLVEEFLNRDDWSVDSLNNFTLAWNVLDEGQRQQVIESRLFRRLRISLHQRIGALEVLSDPGDDGQLQALKDFAAKVGAPYRESRMVADDQSAPAATIPEADDIAPVEDAVARSDAAVVVAPVVTEEVEAQPAQEVASRPAEQEASAVESSEKSESTATTAAAAVPTADDNCPVSLAVTRRPYCRDALSDGSEGPQLVVLPTGNFKMGSTANESEAPQHQVDIVYHIAMSQYEITAGEYQQFCNATSLPCAEQAWGDDAPVVSVSWDDANMYTEWLTETTGRQYRLPTEAEWEYAARAGTDSPYFFGDEITPSAAHSAVNGPAESPLARGDRRVNRNPFRLYHMAGNVREWTQDSWYPTYDGAPADGAARASNDSDQKVVRGGSYTDPGAKLRSAAREPLARTHRDPLTGFRVVREIAEGASK